MPAAIVRLLNSLVPVLEALSIEASFVKRTSAPPVVEETVSSVSTRRLVPRITGPFTRTVSLVVLIVSKPDVPPLKVIVPRMCVLPRSIAPSVEMSSTGP